MAEKYINIKDIYSRVLQHPMLTHVKFEHVVTLAFDFIRIIGAPGIYHDKVEEVKVENYMAELPCDYESMIQIKDKKTDLPYRYTTDSFHLNRDGLKSFDLTYKIQGGFIYTSIEEGELIISYKALLVDDDMYPLIPDNSSFSRALELYIKKHYFTVMFDMGLLKREIYENVKQEYAWAAGDCESEFKRLSIDKAESFYNSWSQLIVRRAEHGRGFINTGSKELYKNH